jgi:hypothetical protein
MDDPWGSPWADELHQSPPTPESKGTKRLTLDPIAQGKNAVATEKTNSLWDVPGDGFGSWAEAPPDQDIKKNGEISGVSLDWNSRGDGVVKKIDISGISPHWDESQAGSTHSTPKLSSGPLPKPSEFLRRPSPDPWASITVSPDVEHKDIPEITSHDKDANSDSAIIANPPGTSRAKQPEELLPGTKEKAVQESTDDMVTGKVEPKADLTNAKRAAEASDKGSDVKEADELSRSSSSPSDQSHHDEAHSESPRTSLDDDTHRPEVHRHVSEKIQVLVEHYDALAKAQLEETVIAGKSPHPERSESDNEEGYGEQQILSDVGPKNGMGLAKNTKAEEREALEEDEAATKSEDDEKGQEREREEEEDDDFGDFEEGQSQSSEAIRDGEQTSDGQAN